jgi:hypothetical protein
MGVPALPELLKLPAVLTLPVLLTLICVATVGPCLGSVVAERSGWVDDTAWLRAELAVFGRGASVAWPAASLAAPDVGDVRAPGPGPARGDLGRKVTAGLLSLVLPGAGQFYNGDRQKAYVFAGVDAAVWGSYLTFDTQGNSRSETYRDYAGVYAGTLVGDAQESYWRAMGRYLDSDAYNEAVLREARAFATEPIGLIGADQAWQWSNEDHFHVYQELRADANRAYSRRDFMTLFAILNRVVAVYDAVRHSVDDKLNGQVLGFNVKLTVDPSLRRPATGCVVSRRF